MKQNKAKAELSIFFCLCRMSYILCCFAYGKIFMQKK